MNSIVLKLGGSLLYDADLNLNKEVLDKVKEWYGRAVKEYDAVVIVVGGGKLSRSVNEKVGALLKTDYDRHGVAMELTQTNALVLRGYLGDDRIFCPETLGDAYEYLIGDEKKLLISGGLKRGWSTDMDAALFAHILGLKEVFKLSDIESVYTADPKADPTATPISKITWKEYRELFGITDVQGHVPNGHTPISAESSRYCEAKGITFYVTGGKNLVQAKKLEDIFKMGTEITV
jgi:uridylate kinase